MRYTGHLLVCLLLGACSGGAKSTPEPYFPVSQPAPPAPQKPVPSPPPPIVADHGSGISSVACLIKSPSKVKSFSEITQMNLCESLGARVAICEIDYPKHATPEQVCQTGDMHDERRDEIREECMQWEIAESEIATLLEAVKVCDCGPGPGCRFVRCEDRLSCFRETGLRWSRSSL